MTDWEARWQRRETGWDRGETSPALIRWLELGVAGQRVLVPGAGSGYEVVSLAKAGHCVTAIDLAPSALSRLSTLLDDAGATATLCQADMLSWQAEKPFDSVYEQTSLCALAPDSWPHYIRQLHTWLSPGGTLMAQFMQTGEPGGPPFDCPLERMRELFTDDAWDWQDDTAMRIDHPSGRHEVSIALTRR